MKCFPIDPYQEDDRRISAKITEQLQKEFKDVFIVIDCIDGKSYQVPPICVVYFLKITFKEELESLQ